MNAKNSSVSSLQIKVKACELYNADLNSGNEEKIIDKYTALTTGEGFGSPYGSKNKDQETDVIEGSQMIWSIALSGEKGEEDYSVVLDSIKQGSPEFITNIKKVDGTLVGDVTTNPTFIGKKEPYTIMFHIAKKGAPDTHVLPIDPKLQIKKSGG